MAKGSQLSQLKSALSQAGFTGSQGSKKRKRSNPQDYDKEKRGAKLEDIHKRLNPFDVKVTKLKHEVGGRKVKGVVGRPAQSKQVGIEQRKKTLLKEFEDRGHAGGIVDRRFGESDATMTPEERMLERFTRERQRSSKASVFNLEDEEELTHYGQTLSKLDDFDDVGLRDEDDDEPQGEIGREVVKRTHFGGFEEEEGGDPDDEPARKKTKSEVMAEVMAKSKEHKYLRQMERERGENMRHELDEEFDSLRSLLYAATGSNTVPLGDRDSEADSQAPPVPSIPVMEAVDAYDQRVRELASDRRAKAKDRTKTEEELALEAKEALEEAERRRQRRMRGEDDDSGSDDGRHRPRGKRHRERGGDDLEDDFQDSYPEWNGIGPGLGMESASDEASEPSGSASEGGGTDDEEDNDSEESEAQDGDEEEEADSFLGSEEDDAVDENEATKRSEQAQELPFTFSCPTLHEEFLDIVKDVSDADISTVIHRIRALYHPSLGVDNKAKLQTFMTVLIDHVLHITTPPNHSFELLSSLLPHIFSLTQAFPIRSAEYFVEKLSLMHKNLKNGLAHGALQPDSKTWPGLSELAFLRTIGTIWPSSDMNHPVISPARLLMGAYLGLGRVRSLSDIGSGLFLCTLFLQFEELSKRFVPEAINFLANAVLHLAPHSYRDGTSLPGSFSSPDFLSALCVPLSITDKTARSLSPLKPNIVVLLSESGPSEQAKVDALGLALELICQFANMNKAVDGFIELYSPVQEILLAVEGSQLSEGLRRVIKSSTDTISRLLKFSKRSRRPLSLQAHKPIPIPTYIPKFETSKSSFLRNQDPDHDRKEAAKLRYLVKQERKGAIRELRKDARFLTAVHQRKQEQKDYEYNMRMKRVMGSLESERAEGKALEREKAKARKRARRK